MNCSRCRQDVDLDQWKYCPSCGGSLADERILSFFRNLFLSKKYISLFLIFETLIIGTVLGMYFNMRRELIRKDQQLSEMNALAHKKKSVDISLIAREKILPVAYSGKNMKMAELRVGSSIYGKIRVVSEIPGITEKQTKLIDIRPESKIYYISPEITPEGYGNLSESKKADLKVSVSLINDNQEELLLDDKKEIFLYSRNDIIWENEDGPNFNYIARWVNKDREEVKDLVRTAADHMKELGAESNAMEGVFGDRENIKRQLEAIFLAISQDLKIRYVASPFSYDDSSAQRIKPPEEVIKTRSGLCIELSLLVAAALENVGLNPVIILVPGHAWAGVQISPVSNDYIFIETTALDKSPEEALQIAQKNWSSASKKMGYYHLININELRAEGIGPMRH
jgi:hypothetical protein